MSVLFCMKEKNRNHKTADHVNPHCAPGSDFSPKYPRTKYETERASCWALPGNMTVEAAIVLPLFIYAVINLLSLILLFRDFSAEEGKLHQLGRELSLLSYGQETGEPDIRLVKITKARAAVPIAAFPSAVLVNGCVMHKWTGYDLREGMDNTDQDREELVYVTESGTAWHRDRACVYLNPSVQMLPGDQAETARNKNGRSYKACEICGGRGAIVYVTDSGERYHSTVTCSGLKRTINCIPLSEAISSGRHACPKCGE